MVSNSWTTKRIRRSANFVAHNLSKWATISSLEAFAFIPSPLMYSSPPIPWTPLNNSNLFVCLLACKQKCLGEKKCKQFLYLFSLRKQNVHRVYDFPQLVPPISLSDDACSSWQEDQNFCKIHQQNPGVHERSLIRHSIFWFLTILKIYVLLRSSTVLCTRQFNVNKAERRLPSVALGMWVVQPICLRLPSSTHADRLLWLRPPSSAE